MYYKVEFNAIILFILFPNREHTMNSPLYNLSHMHSMSLNHSGNSPYISIGSSSNTMMNSDGPPTPTQEFESGNDHRKSK